jgi:hypothetical protein
VTAVGMLADLYGSERAGAGRRQRERLPGSGVGDGHQQQEAVHRHDLGMQFLSQYSVAVAQPGASGGPTGTPKRFAYRGGGLLTAPTSERWQPQARGEGDNAVGTKQNYVAGTG